MAIVHLQPLNFVITTIEEVRALVATFNAKVPRQIFMKITRQSYNRIIINAPNRSRKGLQRFRKLVEEGHFILETLSVTSSVTSHSIALGDKQTENPADFRMRILSRLLSASPTESLWVDAPVLVEGIAYSVNALTSMIHTDQSDRLVTILAIHTLSEGDTLAFVSYFKLDA